MPVAISRNSTTNNTTLTENGFITRNYPSISMTENENDFSDEAVDSSEVDDDVEEEEEDEEKDYSDEEILDERREQERLLNSSSVRQSELLAEYFDYQPQVVNNRDRICNHQISSRPCHFCDPKVSLHLANEVRIAYKSLFNPKVIKFDYVPIDKNIIDGPFKSLKALHDLGYIKKVLNEILNLIVSVQNSPNYKINYTINSALLRIHDRTECLMDDVRGSGKLEEYHMVCEFRNKLNAIGMIYGNLKENNSINCSNFIDCQR